MKTHAIVIEAHGGPEVLRFMERELPAPGPGEVQIRHTAIGINFIDIYIRTGKYPCPLPAVLGEEGAGVVTKLGDGVKDFKEGDRVAYPHGTGAYAESRNIAASRIVKLPDFIDDASAASLMLKGLTAEYLLRRTHKVERGETILVYAASGGVGSYLLPWAKTLGATVIGVVGSESKVAIAKASGADHVLLQEPGLAAKVKEITKGRGVDVAYDSVGRDTFQWSLDALRSRGLLVSFGQSSGDIPPFSIGVLSGPRSLFLTRPSLGAYIHTREELVKASEALFEAVRAGIIAKPKPRVFPLKDTAKAHQALESRQTTGPTILVP